MSTSKGAIATYPQPSDSERERRGNPPILSLVVLVFFVISLIFGIDVARNTNIILGVVTVLSSAIICIWLLIGLNKKGW